MATVAITIAAGGNAGSSLRALALAIQRAAVNIPDTNSTGASVVCTISDAPATGVASVQITGGPYQSPLYIAG